MEEEIIVRKLNPSSLLQPILVGAALLFTPFWVLLLLTSPFSGATLNGEHVTGLPAFLTALAMGPSFVFIGGGLLWLYVSACLWAYSKWSELRLRFVPR